MDRNEEVELDVAEQSALLRESLTEQVEAWIEYNPYDYDEESE